MICSRSYSQMVAELGLELGSVVHNGLRTWVHMLCLRQNQLNWALLLSLQVNTKAWMGSWGA